MLDLSIIILSYNTKDVTKKALDALKNSLQNSIAEAQIVIVDNASKDKSTEMLQEYKKKFENKTLKIDLILNKDNLGYPKGNNQGLKISNGKYVLFLNSDAIIQD